MLIEAFANELEKIAVVPPLAKLVLKKELADKAGVPTPTGVMLERIREGETPAERKKRLELERKEAARKAGLHGTASERFVQSRTK